MKETSDSRIDTTMTVREVAHALGVHINTVRRWSSEGKLATYRVGPRRDRRFHSSDVNNILVHEDGKKALVGACGISCEICRLYAQGLCKMPCAAGTDKSAVEKLRVQMQTMELHCPILACAIEKGIGYCLRDCRDVPCTKFDGAAFLQALAAKPMPILRHNQSSPAENL